MYHAVVGELLAYKKKIAVGTYCGGSKASSSQTVSFDLMWTANSESYNLAIKTSTYAIYREKESNNNSW